MKLDTQYISAAGLALTASAILSLIDNFVASVSQEAGLWQFQVTRTLFAVPILIVVARAANISLHSVNFPRLVARSLAVSAGLLIYFAALGTLPVAQAGAGLFSAPLWIAILSVLIFGQKIGWIGAMAVVLGFLGALMLLQPDLENLSGLSLLPFASGLFYGLGMLLTRYWCAEEHPIMLTLGIFITIGIVSLFMLVVVTIWPGHAFITTPWVSPSARFLGLTLFQAIGALIAVSLIAQAYRIGNPPVVAVFEYSFLIFASIWGFILWGTPTNGVAVIGIILILASGILTAITSRAAS